jgi:4-carboxymuconolactone decarboxylase
MSELPFNPNDLDPKNKLIYEAMVAERKSHGAVFAGPYAALMNHPELCQKIEALGSYLKFQGHLSRNIYQFVVLAVAQNTGAAFEWIDHVDHAVKAGVPQTVLETLRVEGIKNQKFAAPYHLAAKILNATLIWKNIPSDVQTDGIKTFGMEGFVEIVVLSGFYQMFSAINQGFNVPLPSDTKYPF